MPCNHLILCHLLLLPSIFPGMRVFNESAHPIRWPKYWSFSFSISPSNEYSGLISFRIDLFDLLVVQRTLKSLLQHHSSKASILRCSGGAEVKASSCSVGDLGLIPGSGRFPWRRKWQPTPVFLPEESHGRRSLPGLEESGTTERLHFHFQLSL